VMLIGTEAGLAMANSRDTHLNQSARFTHLNQSARFTDLVAKLPAPSYNLVVYLDIFPIASQITTAFAPNQPQNKLFDSIFGAFGPQLFGATILDGRTLTIDLAQRTDLAALERDLGLVGLGGEDLVYESIDHVPSDSALVVVSHNISKVFADGLANLRQMVALTKDMRGGLNPDDIDAILTFFKNQTGLDFEQDVLPNLPSGDIALFARYQRENATIFSPAFDSIKRPFAGIDFGMVYVNDDPAKAQAIESHIRTIIEKLATRARAGNNIAIGLVDDITGSPITIISILADNVYSEPIELVLGSNDKVFVFATRKAAEEILSGNIGKLSESVGGKEALGYALPNANGFWYIGPQIATFAIDFAAVNQVLFASWSAAIAASISGAATPTPGPEVDLAAIYAEAQKAFDAQFYGLLASSIISTATEGEYSIARATISLGE
jgi:hypothetical protein